MLRWRNFINRDDVINSIFFKNLGRGLIIALFALSTLSAVVYYDDAIAGNGGGGSGGGGGGGGGGGSKGGTSDSAKNESGSNTSPNPGYSYTTYDKWLSDLLSE